MFFFCIVKNFALLWRSAGSRNISSNSPCILRVVRGGRKIKKVHTYINKTHNFNLPQLAGTKISATIYRRGGQPCPRNGTRRYHAHYYKKKEIKKRKKFFFFFFTWYTIYGIAKRKSQSRPAGIIDTRILCSLLCREMAKNVRGGI